MAPCGGGLCLAECGGGGRSIAVRTTTAPNATTPKNSITKMTTRAFRGAPRKKKNARIASPIVIRARMPRGLAAACLIISGRLFTSSSICGWD